MINGLVNSAREVDCELYDLSSFSLSRKDQNTRLAFLFEENAQKFIDVFRERRSRMWQFLSDLENTAVKLKEMKMGASISTVVGSSVGIVGGILSIAGIVLAFFTAGASLGLSLAGVGLGATSAVNTVVTGVTEMAVNSQHEHNAQSYLKSYMDDMIKIVECLQEAANSERPLVQPSAVDTGEVLHCIEGGFQGIVDVVNGAAAVAEHKSTNVITAVSEMTVEGLENAGNAPQVAIKLAKAETLAITKSARVASGFLNAFFIGLDVFFIIKESLSLKKGSESEVSQLIRSRAALWKSELEAWEKIHDSLCIGIKTISESQATLEKPFLP